MNYEKPLACRTAEQLMQTSLDAALSPAERQRLDSHMEACEACRRAWTEYRQVSRIGGQWVDAARHDPGDAFTNRVMAAIAAESNQPAVSHRWASIGWGSAAALAVFASAALFVPSLADLTSAAPAVPSPHDLIAAMIAVGQGVLDLSHAGDWGGLYHPASLDLGSLLPSFAASLWLPVLFVAALGGNIALAASVARRPRRAQ